MSTTKDQIFDFPASQPTGGFAERLEWLLDGRKLTPWAKRLGIGGGSIDALRGDTGRPPSHEFLTRIMHTENTSLSWLLGADIEPFIRIVTTTDAETAEVLGAHLQEEEWAVVLLTDGERSVWVLHQPATLVTHKGELQYRAVTVIAGPSQAMTAVALTRTGRAKIDHVQPVSPANLHAITRGMVGTWRLFGNEKTPGLIRQVAGQHGQPIPKSMRERPRIAEDGSDYKSLPAPARAIAKHWDSLPDATKQAIQLVIERLINPPPAPPDD